MPYAGALTTFPIASGAAALFRGAPVALNQTTGTLVPVTDGVFGTSPRDMYVGIFNGCEYTNASGDRIFGNFFPNGTVTADAVGSVIFDPNVLFKIQVQAANFDAIANAGKRYQISQHASGNAVNGNSTARLDTAAAAGDTKPYVLVGISEEPENPNASGFVNVLVRINTGIHMLER
jgi:hypothetical protein